MFALANVRKNEQWHVREGERSHSRTMDNVRSSTAIIFVFKPAHQMLLNIIIQVAGARQRSFFIKDFKCNLDVQQ